MSPSDHGETIAGLATDLSARLAEIVDSGLASEIPDEAIGQVFATVLRAFAAKAQNGETPRPFGGNSAVTQTEVMIGCIAMLQAVDSNVFELGMWNSMSSVGKRIP